MNLSADFCITQLCAHGPFRPCINAGELSTKAVQELSQKKRPPPQDPPKILGIGLR